jgi:hypothetical protein
MTGAPPLLQTSCLPCQADPERWFDRQKHAYALAGCRGCPARRWCAREALQCRATFGLWAGVWIDGRHENAAPHLQAIATGTLAQSSAVAAVLIDERSQDVAHRGDPGQTSLPLNRPGASPLPRSVTTAILARSSGHCEVLAKGCRYTSEHLVSRHTAVREASTPPDLFAACDVCAGMITALDPKLAARFGYVIDVHRDPAHVPFYWRGSRWVLLDRDGWLTEMRDDAQTA